MAIQWFRKDFIKIYAGDIPKILGEDPGSWDKVGPAGVKRLTEVWCTGSSEPFFMTVAPMVSFKFEPANFYANGMALRKSNYKDEMELVLVKPVGATAVQVDLDRLQKDGVRKVRVTLTLMSGQEILDKELDEDCTWWALSTLLHKEYQYSNNFKFLVMGKVVARQWFHHGLMQHFGEEDVGPDGFLPKRALPPKLRNKESETTKKTPKASAAKTGKPTTVKKKPARLAKPTAVRKKPAKKAVRG